MKIQLQISWVGQSTSHQWGFPLRIFSPPSLFLWRPLLAPWQPIFEDLSFTFLSEPGRIITLTCLTNSFSTLICHLGSQQPQFPGRQCYRLDQWNVTNLFLPMWLFRDYNKFLASQCLWHCFAKNMNFIFPDTFLEIANWFKHFSTIL